jgi:two-component system sensor histidine kinase DesK
VEGYRELSLPGEVARAKMALAAAEIEAVLPNSTEDVPSEMRELFAWTIREGVTNVIRHSNATRCEVVLHEDRVEVLDDGVGPQQVSAGHGLMGLRERAGAKGATVVTRVLEPGFSLSVVSP